MANMEPVPIVHHPRVLSDHALSEFLFWTHSQSDECLESVMQKVYLTIHKGPGNTRPVRVKIRGEYRPLKELPCQDVGCERCGRATATTPEKPVGKGGYKFQWMGPWTVIQPVPVDMTVHEYRRRIREHEYRQRMSTLHQFQSMSTSSSGQ